MKDCAALTSDQCNHRVQTMFLLSNSSIIPSGSILCPLYFLAAQAACRPFKPRAGIWHWNLFVRSSKAGSKLGMELAVQYLDALAITYQSKAAKSLLSSNYIESNNYSKHIFCIYHSYSEKAGPQLSVVPLAFMPTTLLARLFSRGTWFCLGLASPFRDVAVHSERPANLNSAVPVCLRQTPLPNVMCLLDGPVTGLRHQFQDP
jgi:hypothetical protein